MEELFNKELNLISIPIKKLIEKKLLEGFNNRKGHKVLQLKHLNLIDINVDNDNSEIKATIIINSVVCFADVEVRFHEHGTQNDTLHLQIPKKIILSYNFENKVYEINNEDDLFLLDKTTY